MERGEAKATALLLMEKVCGWTVENVLMDNGKSIASEKVEDVREKAWQVNEGAPVQHVLGVADVCGMELLVEPGVLIPRPETEELVRWIVADCGQRVVNKTGQMVRMLDVGTGSGCIAVVLAKMVEGAEVEAWDVSEVALRIAKRNAEKQGVKVSFEQVDVLGNGNDSGNTMAYDIIVSNPPYICEEESAEMDRNVLEHEPRLALFVPNNNPLIFYKKIVQMGMRMLKEGGGLYFEVNRRFGNEVVELLKGMNYQEVELRKDMFGNDRMVKAIKG
jgi:release factor glutamine methyltransferase